MALSLADFDPQVVAEYDVTAKTLDRVVRYRLWEVIFEEMKQQRAERRVEYAVPEPTYVPLREGAGEED